MRVKSDTFLFALSSSIERALFIVDRSASQYSARVNGPLVSVMKRGAGCHLSAFLSIHFTVLSVSSQAREEKR